MMDQFCGAHCELPHGCWVTQPALWDLTYAGVYGRQSGDVVRAAHGRRRFFCETTTLADYSTGVSN
jgi:hypothetical protein